MSMTLNNYIILNNFFYTILVLEFVFMIMS